MQSPILNSAGSRHKESLLIVNEPVDKIIKKAVSSGMYELEKCVPVFSSHKRYDAEGNELYEVKAKDLEKICQNTNDNIGLYIPPVTIGHRDHNTPNFPEIAQPQILGFALNFTVENNMIVCDILWKKGCSCSVEYPYRSAEYVPEHKRIVGIAFLKKTPYLGLGTYLYHNNGAVAVPSPVSLASLFPSLAQKVKKLSNK